MDKQQNPSLWRWAGDCPILHPEATKDCILPDSYPDVHKILYTGADCIPGKTLLSGGKMQTDGILWCKVLFADDEGDLHEARFQMEYDGQMPYTTGEGSECLSARTVVESVTARALNPRKLSFRARLAVSPMLFYGCSGQPRLAPELAELSLEKKLSSFTAWKISGWSEHGIEAGEDLSLTHEAPMGKLLYSDLKLTAESCNAGEGEVRFGGTGQLPLFYITPDSRVQYANISFPIRSSLQGDAMEGDLCKVTLTPEEITVVPSEDATGEARGVELDFTYSVAVTIARKLSCTRPVDCYSVEQPTETVSETVELFTEIGDLSREFSRNLEGEAAGMKSVSAAFAKLTVDSKEKGESGTVLHCAAQVTVIGTDGDGAPLSVSLAENFPVTVDVSDAGEPCFCRFQWTMPPAAVIDGEQIKVRLSGKLSGFVAHSGEVSYVGSVIPATGDLPSAGDSITLCYPAPGETLWDIAKRYRIPQRAILSANDIPEGNLPTVLLIPH